MVFVKNEKHLLSRKKSEDVAENIDSLFGEKSGCKNMRKCIQFHLGTNQEKTIKIRLLKIF